MKADELWAIIEFLRRKVRLKDGGSDGGVCIEFATPTRDEMIGVGLDAEGCTAILEAPWWEEMVTDILETPGMCDPDDSPEQILEFARDVVAEYLRKRS